MTSVVLSLLTHDDAPEIFVLQRAVFVSEALAYGTPFIPPLTQSYDELLDELNHCVGLVLREGPRLIGSVRISERDGESFIGRLMIAPDKQGQGLGSRLLKEIQRYATTPTVSLFSGGLSAQNIKLYQRHGFDIVRRELDSNGIEVVVMRKQLS